MTRRASPLHGGDLRGAARLATDATLGLADLVEAMHERIARVPGTSAPADAGRTGGISGLVYKSIRGVTRLTGGSIDALLGALAPSFAPSSTPTRLSPEREAVVASLNGVLGDYLATTANPLAITMSLRVAGRPLSLQRQALADALPQAGPRVLLLLHGLCMSDLQWQRDGHDHGAALARELGYTPLYLHYNSGQHVSLNGRALSQLLEQVVAQWPQPVERLVLLGHSMGGLLARSALHHATQAATPMQWATQLSDLVFLGTPQHGAPLERAGSWVHELLGATPYAAPFARLGKLRSAGITDLRHGNLLDEDWVGRDRFARGADRRQPVPLPEGKRCFAVAATLGKRGGDVADRLLGDGLVPLDSALGRHADPERELAFAKDRQAIVYGCGHLDLLSRPEVYAHLQRWLA